MSATLMRVRASETTGESRGRRLYFDDVWTWSRQQAEALRRRDFGAVDWDNVIEEVRDVGNRHFDAWISHCRNVISHLLKIEHADPADAADHWRKETVAWRREMYAKLVNNPGMKGEIYAMLVKAWGLGRADALQDLTEQAGPVNWAGEKRIRRSWQRRLSRDCPYSRVEVTGHDPFDKVAEPEPDVWPSAVAQRLNETLGRGYPVRQWEPDREDGHAG